MNSIHLLLLFLPVICSSNLVPRALNKESIVGGTETKPGTFPYQTSILGRKNFSDTTYLLCNAGVIAKNLILSVAQCFVNETTGDLKEFTYSVLIDKFNIDSKEDIEIFVSLIYVPDYYIPPYENDILIAQLAQELDLDNNTRLKKLNLPPPGKSFLAYEGVIAGYEYLWIKYEVRLPQGTEKVIDGELSSLIRYGVVSIVYQKICMSEFPDIDFETHICGLMLNPQPELRKGTCFEDVGSPLVVNNMVVGMPSRNRPDCNDGVQGSLYTKVSAHMAFIGAIMKGFTTNNTKILQNRLHLEPLAGLSKAINKYVRYIFH